MPGAIKLPFGIINRDCIPICSNRDSRFSPSRQRASSQGLKRREQPKLQIVLLKMNQQNSP
jgi:hypothetical protein